MPLKIEIDGDSEEAVALALLHLVADAEDKLGATGTLRGVDRAWILDTYAECLAAVDGNRDMTGSGPEDGENDEDEGDEEEDEDAPAKA